MMFFPIIKGFLVNSGFIVAIGAQNAFVIREGIAKQRVLLTILICSLADIVLISSGVLGVGKIMAQSPTLMSIIKWSGISFLVLYGCSSLRQTFCSASLNTDRKSKQRSMTVFLLSLLAVILLNPNVYLDAMLIGTIGGQYFGFEKYLFILGTCLSSAIWFFALGYSASYFSEFLKKPSVWRCINLIIAAIMFWIAGSLMH